jgi:hypothetical protein
MENRGIAEIEKAAHDYADVRDERMRMGEEEQRRHKKLLAVMTKHGKQTYAHRNGEEVIEVKVTPKDATAKAKVRIVSVEEYESGKRTPREAVEPEIGGEGEPEVEFDMSDESGADSSIDYAEGDDDGDEDQP